jgi:hypothetical protein
VRERRETNKFLKNWWALTESNPNNSRIEKPSSRMLKKAVSKAAADESTGGVASGLR